MASHVRLSAAMIVRNEEQHLAGCLESVRELVDEIVIVDTGSTDATRAVAGRFGARVLERPWTGDFAAARNVALDHARGRFVLYIDADERVRAGAEAALAGLLDDPSVVAATVRFRPRTGFTRYREVRIFRNDPRIRFTSVIHETMLPALRAVAAAEGWRVAASEVAIDHLGYDGDLRAKHARNVPLLRARLAADPGHVYSWNHLAQALDGLGDHAGARAVWGRAVEIVRAQPSPDPRDAMPYAELLRRGTPGEAGFGALLAEARARFPGDHTLAWIAGRALMAEGRYEEAVAIFERLAAVDPDALCEDHVAHDARIFGVLTHESLGLCHFKCGRYAESARHYGLAADHGGGAASRLRRDLAGSLAGRPQLSR